MALDFEIENNFLFKEGEQKGKQEGKEELVRNVLEQSEMSVREVAKLLRVPEKLVKQIKQKMQ